VVELLEGVHEELPVAPDGRAIEEALGFSNGYPSNAVIIGPRNSVSVWLGSGARFTKMNPAHTSQCTETKL
jgi:hypothetical protein